MAGIKIKIIKRIQNILGIAKEEKFFYTKDNFVHKRFIIGDFSYGCPTILFENENANLTIGKYCSIAGNVTIFLGGNHRYDWVTTYPFNVLNTDFPFAKGIEGHPSTNGDVIIGNDVWIGHGVTIMSGVKISDGAVIAANSLITKNVGPYEIWGGNPAAMIKRRFNDDVIKKLLKIEWWNKDTPFIEKNIHLLLNEPSKFIEKYDKKN